MFVLIKHLLSILNILIYNNKWLNNKIMQNYDRRRIMKAGVSSIFGNDHRNKRVFAAIS